MSNSLLKYINNNELGSDIDAVKDYTINTLPSPELFGYGTRILCDGVSIESMGNRFIRTTKPGKLQLIGGRNHIPDTCAAMGTLARGYNIWKPFNAKVKMNKIRLVFTNWYVQQNGVEADNTNTYTLHVSVYKENSTVVVPVYFSGVRVKTMALGETVISDEVPIELDPTVDSGLYMRIRIECAATTDTLPTSSNTVKFEGTGLRTWRLDNPTTDFVDNLAYSKTSAYYGAYEFSPVATLGVTETGEIVPSVAIFGSSSAEGSGDDQSTVNPQFVKGYLARSLTRDAIPYIAIPRSGETAENFCVSYGKKRKWIVSLCNCTHGVNTYGSNDISKAGSTLNGVKAFVTAVYNQIKGFGLEPIMCTYTPATTSSDSFATEANQTVGSVFRAQMSEWIRTSTGWRYFDLEAVSDSGRVLGLPASGKWRVDLGQPTTDGLHCTPILHKTISDSISWNFIKF